MQPPAAPLFTDTMFAGIKSKNGNRVALSYCTSHARTPPLTLMFEGTLQRVLFICLGKPVGKSTATWDMSDCKLEGTRNIYP